MTGTGKNLRTTNDVDLGKFSHILKLCKATCNVQNVAISLINGNEQIFVETIGFEATSPCETSSFCGSTLEKGALQVIEDASIHPDFASDSMVINEPRVRFYAGIPLTLNNKGIGTICLFDNKPRKLSEHQEQVLKALGETVKCSLELQERNKEYKNLLQTYKSTNDKYESFVEEGFGLLCTHDLKGNIVHVNKAAASALSRPVEELEQLNLIDILSPNFKQHLEGYLERIQKNGFDEGIMEVTTPKGETKYWSYRNKLNAASKEVIGFSLDVTEKLHFKKNFKQQQAILNEAQRLARFGTWSLDLEKNTVEISTEVHNIIGISPSESTEVNIETFQENLRPRDRKHLYRIISKAIESQERFEFEYKLVDREYSDPKFISGTGRALFNSKGKAIKIIGSVQDVSSKRRENENVKAIKNRLELALKAAKIGTWQWNIKSDSFFWDEQMHKLYNLPNDGTFKTFSDFATRIDKKDRLRVLQALATSAENGQEFKEEFCITSVVGETRHVRANGRSFNGKMIGICIDVTETAMAREEIIEAKEKAEELANMKQEFLANMSHEIRTPMNSILGFARIILEQDQPESNEYANLIYEAGENLLVIINDILDFSKIEAGKMELEEISFDLHKLAKTTEQLFTHRADDKGLKFQVTVAPDTPRFQKGDPVRIGQILNNLVGNAMKFTEKGFVNLNIKPKTSSSSEILFEITDSGVGISQENQANIFNSFEQAEGHTTRRFGGTGLGLAIVKKLSELMKGGVTVQSELGKGSVFTVTLPSRCCGEKALTINTSLTETDFKILNNLKVLLVEDNKNNQLLGSRFLKTAGCETVIANNGLEALEVYSQQDFDLILMDVQMPEMDGIECTHEIRKMMGDKGSVPIVALTAHAMNEEKEKIMKAGMSEFLTKPFRPYDLYRTMHSTLASNTNPAPEEKSKIRRMKFSSRKNTTGAAVV